MKELLSDILIWMKDPKEVSVDLGFKTKVNLLLRILFLDILIATVFLGLVYLIHIYVVKLSEPLIDFNPFSLLVLAIIVIPLMEELIFRLPLKYDRNYFAKILDTYFNDWIKDRWDFIFKYFMYFMALLFGLMHLSNFENHEAIFYCLGPIIVGSQIIGGFLISYTRIKLGFLWGYLQHALFNLFGIAIGLLIVHNQVIINESTQEYNLKVTELAYIYNEDSSYSSDFKGDIYHSIKAEDVNLQSIIDKLSLEDDKVYDDVWVDFYFESEEGIDSKVLIELLKNNIKFE